MATVPWHPLAQGGRPERRQSQGRCREDTQERSSHLKNVLHITAALGLSALLSLLGVEVAGATAGDAGRQVTAVAAQATSTVDIDWP